MDRLTRPLPTTITLPSFLFACGFERTKANYRRRISPATAWRLFGDYLGDILANESKNTSLKNTNKWLIQAVYCTMANIGKQYLAFLVRTRSSVQVRLSALKKPHKQAVFEEAACYFFVIKSGVANFWLTKSKKLIIRFIQTGYDRLLHSDGEHIM